MPLSTAPSGTGQVELVRLQEASFGYGDHPVVHEVSVSLHRGDVLAVLGPNGSGKSTLVKGMLGLVPRLGGQLSTFGQPVLNAAGRRRVGYVPQHLPGTAAVPATVAEVVATGRSAHRGALALRPWLSAADRAAVTDAIAAVDLTDRTKHSIQTLSGGQQRRAILARALATQPELLLLDEPTAGLDRASQRTLAGHLTGLLGRGITVVVVTHGLGVLESLVTRSLELRDGRVVHDSAHRSDQHDDDHHPHHIHEPAPEAGRPAGPGLIG